MRINSYYPGNPKYKSNLYQIARCYELAGHYLEAVQTYDKILQLEEGDWLSVYRATRDFQEINYFYESNKMIEAFIGNFEQERKDSLSLVMFVNLLNLQKFDKANTFINAYEASEDLAPKVKNFQTLMNSEMPLPTKSKTKAGIMSIIIPGSGYMYAGKVETGIAALLVNSLFIYITYMSFKEDNTGLGIFAGFFTLGFYAGSIYGGIQATKDYNHSLKIEFIKKFNL